MEKSKIRLALEKIDWAFLEVIDAIDRYKKIDSECLAVVDKEIVEALELVKSLCDHITDNKDLDLQENLELIHDEAVKISRYEYGEVPYESRQDDQKELFDKIFINVANIGMEIQHCWIFNKFIAPEPQRLENLLPKELNTPEAVKVFERAIKADLMEICDDGLKWKATNALLAYLCGRLYCSDTITIEPTTKDEIVKRGSSFFPETPLNDLFKLKNLGQSRLQLYRRPKGFEKIDDLFRAAQ